MMDAEAVRADSTSRPPLVRKRAPWQRACLVIFVPSLAALFATLQDWFFSAPAAIQDARFLPNGDYNIDTEFCNIPKFPLDSPHLKDFFTSEVANKQPFIFTQPSDGVRYLNAEFQARVEKSALLRSHGNVEVVLSSSNSYSRDRSTMPAREYIETLDQSRGMSKSGPLLSNETWYFFGENFGRAWSELNTHYVPPPLPGCEEPSLSFGIGGRGSGVQWHFHGPGFSEVFHGRKRWFLYPSPVVPDFNPDHTCLQWLNTIYKALNDESRPLECTIDPGDVLYFPHGWYHAILNLDEYTVFMSAFSFL